MENNGEIRNIDWRDTLSLRQQVLWPNKPIEFCHVEDDDTAWHFGVFIDEQLVCVASVYPKDDRARLRKFATLESFQNQGIGSTVLTHILNQLKTENINTFWCDARESALGFYQRFGMQIEGERFYKGEVPYYKMSVDLRNHEPHTI